MNSTPRTDRNWGHYVVLRELPPGVKVKELVVAPGAKLSMQKHAHRSELWFVAQGQAVVYTGTSRYVLNTHDTYHVPRNDWHRLSNETDEPLSIIEIQYGQQCTEDDITRLEQ